MTVNDGWYETSTGRIIYPSKPNESCININDIAYALSNICRFGGHSSKFYSVAQHCVLVSTVVSPANALLGLMHDASEAYLGDVVRPLRLLIRDYQTLESAWNKVILRKFQVTGDHTEVKEADNHILSLEISALTYSKGGGWPDFSSPRMPGITIDPWTPALARRVFIAYYYGLANAKRRRLVTPKIMAAMLDDYAGRS